MFATRFIQLLLAALTVFSVSQALMVDANIANREVEDIVKRQGTNPPTSRPSTSPPATSTNPPTSISNTPTSTPPSSSPPPTSQTTPPTSSSNSPSSTPPSSSDQSPSPTPTPTPSTSTQVITSTNADGKPTTLTSTSVSTPTPTLAGGQNGGPSGMSDTTRNTIIGVVVGVGGAIILAVVAFVAWRIWGRKKAVDQDDGMTNYSGPTEKVDGSSTTGRSPFQSTLESYHAPTQVNTASNF